MSHLIKLFIILLILLLPGCKTLDRMAIKSTENLVKYQFLSFLEEDDTLLAREAMASNLKMLDGLLKQDPSNPLFQTLLSRVLFSYSFSYVHDEDPERASKLYLRGLKSACAGLGGEAILFEISTEEFKKKLKPLILKQKDQLFWAMINFASWIDLNKSELLALNNLEKVRVFGEALIDEDPDYFFGSAFLLLALYHASRPPSLGGDIKRAELFFKKALDRSQSQFLLSPFFYLKTYSIQTQNTELFDDLSKNILSFEVDSFIPQRLTNRIIQEKTLTLLEDKDDFFL